jgi:hypothetical protein
MLLVPNSQKADATKDGQTYTRFYSALVQRAKRNRQKRGAIITIVNAADPPLRLLLGKDAVLIARRIDQAKLAETDRWEKLSSSTDFDDSEEYRFTHLGLPQSSQETTK